MIFAIAGITETVIKYQKKHGYVLDKDIISIHTRVAFDAMTENDTLVLLPGWWGKSWAKKKVKEVIEERPEIPILYLDGQFGESERKTLKSDTIHDRFEILDFKEH